RLGVEWPAASAGVSSLIGWTCLAAVVVISVRHARSHTDTAFELSLIAAFAVLLDPWLFFVAYFCFLHSIKHARDVALGSGASTASVVLTASLFSILALVLIISGVLLGLSPASVNQGLIQGFFIGLAALTVPHMLLNEFAMRKGIYH
ncbi:MAG: Brp/Blh family beta-carotene 15,15'-dioxygenase, partial [Pseudomonadota bacterium]